MSQLSKFCLFQSLKFPIHGRKKQYIFFKCNILKCKIVKCTYGQMTQIGDILLISSETENRSLPPIVF